VLSDISSHWLIQGDTTMIVERQKNELVIRIPEKIDAVSLQNFINYLKVKTIVSKSRASKAAADGIAGDIKQSWWKKNSGRFVK
jgi:hypothetical protein